MYEDEEIISDVPEFVGSVAELIEDEVSGDFYQEVLVNGQPLDPSHIRCGDIDSFTRGLVRPVLGYLGYDDVGSEDYGFRSRMSNGKKIAFVVIPMNHELSSSPVDVRDLLLNECLDFVAVTDGLRWVYAYRHGEIVSLGDVVFDSSGLVRGLMGLEGGREPDPKIGSLFVKVFGYDKHWHPAS